MTRDLARHGIGVATTVPHPPKHPCAVEVYPHVALLALLDRSYRVPYKVSRSTQYWPGLPVRTRIGKIRTELRAIVSGLEDVLGSLPFSLPPSNRIPTLAHLKRYEDALDALVSAWVGSRLIDGKAEPFGDEESAIWVPRG